MDSRVSHFEQLEFHSWRGGKNSHRTTDRHSDSHHNPRGNRMQTQHCLNSYTEYMGKRLARDGGIVSLVASGSGSSGAWMKQVRTSTEKDMAARNVCSLREWHVLQKVFRTCSILYILT